MSDHEQPYWQIIKPYIRPIDIYHDEKTYFDSISKVPMPMVLIYAADFCLAEIHNGGLLSCGPDSFANPKECVSGSAALEANVAGRVTLFEVAPYRVKRHGAKLFPSVALREDALADSAGTAAAIFFLGHFEKNFVCHGVRLTSQVSMRPAF